MDVRTACLLQIGDGAEHVESRAVPEDALVHLEGGAVHGVVRGGIVVGDIEEGKDAGDHLLEIGEVLVAVQKPLYEVASSHTARKTFVGNLYRQVPDPNLIASMSGHVECSRAFRRYRTIDDDMKRKLVEMIN